MDEAWEAYKARGFQGRLDAADVGKNPAVIARMRSGYTVMCDTQLLPAYAIQLPVPLVEHLNSLRLEAQTVYLQDMVLIGRAVEEATRCKRVMYGIFGGLYPVLHIHIQPRYAWEGEDFGCDVGHAYSHRFLVLGGEAWKATKTVERQVARAYDRGQRPAKVAQPYRSNLGGAAARRRLCSVLRCRVSMALSSLSETSRPRR